MPSNKFNSQDTSEKRDPEEQGFKQVSFQALHCLHRANESMHNGFYYLLMLIESLQIFYYVTHPFFPYYQNSAIMTSIHQFLKYLVFNEFLAVDSNLYRYALPVCFAFIVLQVVMALMIAKEIKQKKLINEVRKIHFAANVMFLVLNSILTIPFFGISLNVLYCDTQSNKYTLGQACYQGSHIAYCLIATLVILALLLEWGINWYIYYNKNPFGTDYLSKYDNNAVLGKFLLKILPIVYMSIDKDMSLVNVFIFGLAGCMCGYIFFFRLFSFHDYNQRNFYFVLFLQVVLAWFSINNIILSYLDTDRKAGGLFESFFCSLLVAALVVQIEEENYKKIFMEGLQAEKVKKQNIQKFIYRLIYMFAHSKTNDQKNQLSTIVKILSSKLKDTSVDPSLNQLKISKKVQTKLYTFLSRFVLQYLQSNWNIMLMCINCNLLILDQKFSYAFHQSLQVSSKKISVVQQLMMYRFRRHQRYDKQKLDTIKKQNNNIFMMYYDFNQNLMRLEQQIALCTFNNLDYWQQVCQPNPSIYKIRNLAQKYQHHIQLIDQYYNKIYDIFPNNKLAIKTYIEFLVYVGVNISGLAKAKQRYQQAEKNIKKTKELQRDSGNLIQMGENENLAFVSIETCEMSLATITNCNTQFKKMLGYDKHELVDKKVNKLMPKAYSQFHDGLVRGYIQKKQHNQKNKLQRVVYAMSKQNYLVQVVLFTKVNYKTIGEKSSLQLIGFLKKIEDPNKAVIILQVNSMNIIGANVGFSKLIQDGINNSELANSQIKIMTLLPNIDASSIQQGKLQETNLVFSSSVIDTKSGLNLEVKKKVSIEVEQIKEYSTKHKLAYLVLKEIGVEDHDQAASKKSMINVRKNTPLSQKSNTKQTNKNVKVLTSQVSIMQDQSSLGTYDSDTMKAGGDINDKDLEIFHMIQRKKDEFLKNQHLDVFRYILWGTLITFVCLTIGLLVFDTILDYNMIISSNEIKSQIKNSYVIGYQTAQINKMIQKVMQGSAYNSSEFQDNSKKLSTSKTRFQQNFIPMMTMSTKYDFPLQLNQFRYYNIVIENEDEPEYAQQTIIDAFFQYISSAKNYAAYTLKDVTTSAIHQMVQQNTFIQQNGKQLFPTISKKMSLQYLDLDKLMFNHFTIKQFIITISYAANLILALLLIAVLIKKINTFNQSVVSLYNQIKLWDATQMKNKCIKFIERNSNSIMKNHNNKRRLSSLLNVFPQKTFIKVLESVQGQQLQNNGNMDKINRSNNNNANGKSLNTSNEQDQFLKIQTSQQQQNKQQPHTLPTQKSKKFYVLLPQKNKLRFKFIIFSIIATIFIGGYFTQYFYSTQYQKKVLYYNQRISQLGNVRNNIAFINYYTYELMLKPQDESYRRLLKKEIGEFYVNTDACFDLIGDPAPILKKSYNVVEQAYALIFSDLNIPANQRYNIKNPKYILQQVLFQQSIQDLSNLIQYDLDKMANDLITNIKTLKITFIISYIFLNLILALIIKFWMLQQILKNSKKSKSMISMLPPWLIERNKGISQIMQ